MQIETDEWMTASEASRLLGVTHTRIAAMADEDGSLDIIRPWPRMSLVSVASVTAWQGGARQPRIQPAQVRKWLLARMRAATVQELDIDVVRDEVRDFIEEARPRWADGKKDLWALDMASHLWRGGSPP